MKTAVHPKNEPRRDEALVDLLTGRQQEILNLVSSGHTNREIAVILQISVRTVEVHRFQLMRKLNVRNVAQLLRRSLQLRLLSSSDMRARPGDRGIGTVVRVPVESRLRKAITGHARNSIQKSKIHPV
jgi:DNA-binding CsgD family transcriptional regulator